MISDNERFRDMAETFGQVARRGTTCGMHVHVAIDSPEEGVRCIDRITPWLPILLAVSTNSPYEEGRDTGYASWRTQLWSTWPSAGPTEPFGSHDGYRRACERMMASGAARDPGMLYFDARLSVEHPTLEVRVLDAVTDPEDVGLLTALVRALVETAANGWPEALPVWRAEELRAARWRASRYGLADRLLDPVTHALRPAREAPSSLVDLVADRLEEAGDSERVARGVERVLGATGASRQRAAYERTGSLEGVVDDVWPARGTHGPPRTAPSRPRVPTWAKRWRQHEFTRADRTRYREKVRRCLDVFARMLREARFDTDDPMTGLEVELNLVDDRGDPALKSTEALAAIADPAFQTELGLFNIEINVPPVKLREGGLETFEELLRRDLNGAEAKSAEVGAHLVMIGILPTLAADHMTAESISPNPRYKLLGEQILNARGEDISIQISGIGNVDRLETTTDSIVPEAACTSTQFHVQTSPDSFAEYWNASQAISAIQLALCANSPYLLGHELWRETRIPLFEQSTDTRAEELKAQGVRPRVWFGERWITRSSTCSRRTSATSRRCCRSPTTRTRSPCSRTAACRCSRSCGCTTGRSTAGTGPSTTSPGESRTCGSRTASWPPARRWWTPSRTPPSTSGWSGALAESERPLWSQMSFSAAEENFHVAAQHGIDAQVYWPGVGQVRATELTLRRLLPLAREGLAAWGVESATSDRLLGIIEQRCLLGTNGAEWFVRRMRQRSDMERFDALRATLLEYRELMHTNEPVHTWD